MNHKRVTIQDVAQVAGVSRQTVSRAINNLGEISPETRARVLSVAEEMGYRPSSIARGLATQRTCTLGLVVPDVANPFFAEVARGATREAYAQGYSVFLCNTDEEPAREASVLQSLEEKRVDGVLLCSSRLEADALCDVLERYPAVVLFNRRPEVCDIGLVLIDDALGGAMATRHLLTTGHRRVGFLAGPPASRSGRLRAAGYRTAMLKAGCADPDPWVMPCAPSVSGGREAARDLLTAHPTLTGLFCYNDLVAVGALQACGDLGRPVPDAVAIVGFDDIPLAALVTPALTTCRVPRYALGQRAMRLLLDQIEGDAEAPGEYLVEPQLVIRDSAPGISPG